MFLFLVTFGFLSHHLFGKGLMTRFIICIICLLASLYVATFSPCYIVGGVWDLIASVLDRASLLYNAGNRHLNDESHFDICLSCIIFKRSQSFL